MNKVHDSSYKFLFSNPEFVRDLVMGFIPDDWLHSLFESVIAFACALIWLPL